MRDTICGSPMTKNVVMILGYNLRVRAAAVWYIGSILRSILGSFIHAKYQLC